MILNSKITLNYDHKDFLINVIFSQALEKKSKIKLPVVYILNVSLYCILLLWMETHDENSDQCGYIFIITLATTENNRGFIHIIIAFLLYNVRKPSLCRNITFCIK